MDETIDLTMFDAGDNQRPSSPHNTRETAIVIDDSDDDSDMAQKMPAAFASRSSSADNNHGGSLAAAGSPSAQTLGSATAAPSSPHHTCALPSCGRQGKNLKRCSACLSVHYCNSTCQHSHWSDHRKECRKTTNSPFARNTTVKREQQYATSTSARVSMSPTMNLVPSTVSAAARSNKFSCSLCPQTFPTQFLRRKHEKRCRKKMQRKKKKKVKAERLGRGNQVVKAEEQKAKEKEEGEEDVEEADDITYTSYRPQKLRFGVDHPDPVVENSTLSAVVPPEVEYNLAMPADILSKGKLSNLQLEAIVYGCQRHLIDLPVKEETSFVDGEVVVEKPVRAGFLLGDGAGEMIICGDECTRLSTFSHLFRHLNHMFRFVRDG